MRFYLDHDVSALCRKVLGDAGHEAWTASQASLATDEDDVQVHYALHKGAVLVGHDAAFARRRQSNTAGRSIWLNCLHPDAPALLGEHLDQVLAVLEHRAYVVVEIQPSGLSMHQGWE